MASNAEYVSIWWRHHGKYFTIIIQTWRAFLWFVVLWSLVTYIHVYRGIINRHWGNQFWVGVTKPIFSVRLFPNSFKQSNQRLPVWYHVYIWQVSLQLSCRDTWQIHVWTWLKVSNLLFCQIEIFRNGEINERSFSNPHPRWLSRCQWGNPKVYWNTDHIKSKTITQPQGKHMHIFMDCIAYDDHQWPILLTWFNFNPSMDK